LLELAEQYGQKHALGIFIGISLTQQDLASIIGATRESVTVVLGDLKSEGLIQVARQKIFIRDIASLAAVVQTQPPSVGVVSRAEQNANQFRTGIRVLNVQSEELHDSAGL